MDNRPTRPDRYPDPPEKQKFATKPALIAVTVGFGVLVLIALFRGVGPGGALSAKGIGPLTLGKATIPEMQVWALGPINFWFRNADNPPVVFKGKLWEYDCVNESTTFGAPCRSLFGFRDELLVTVETNNPSYYTVDGTHIGTPLEQSLKQEHGTWSGWSVACPHLSLPAPKGVTFLATVARNAGNPKGFVTGFYLSKATSSFRFCAS
jgi:hypothetical protein